MLKLKSNKRKSNIKQGIAYVILTLLAIMCIFPFYVLITNTTRSHAEINRGFSAVPGSLLVTNIRKLMLNDNLPVLRALFNSVYVAVLTAAAASYFSSLTAYGLFAYRFKMRRAAQSFILLIMMIPTQVGLIGYVLEMKSLNLVNTLWPLIFTFTASPFAAFFMTQFIKSSVPDEIIESARIDGCSEPSIFFKIVVPLIKPGTATIGILVFLWSWNNYLLPLVSVSDNTKYTIPLLISTLGSEFTTDFAAQMTAVGFAIVPVVILFIMGSKTFIEGLTAGAVKG